MLPHGEFVEVHEPLTAEQKWTLTQHEQQGPLQIEAEDARGVKNPKSIRAKLQNRMSKAATETIAKPTAEQVKELESGHH